VKRFIAFLIRTIPRKYLQRFSYLGLKIIGMFYAGHAVQCPVCEKRFRKFLPYGRVNPRANALCPSCMSLERHRLIWLYLKEKTEFLSKPMDVLHIAPEMCFLKRFEKVHQEKYITADLESPWAKVKMDIHNMPFPDDHFDMVLCNHVLEHVTDDIKAMKEIRRVLKPGGWSIMQVPFFSPVSESTREDFTITDAKEREKLFGQSDHVRKYGRDYAKRIEQAGLKAIESKFGTSFSKADAYKYGITRKEIIYIGVRS
jgi:SAM-dependent methyltransferase